MKIFNIHIITNKQRSDLIDRCVEDGEEFEKSLRFPNLNPVIHSLKKLRANTWDVDRVDKMIVWLEDYIND